MSLQAWTEVLINTTVDGPALNTSSSSVSILHVTAKYPFAGNYWYIGRQLRIVASGRVSNIVTSPGTLQLFVMLGGTAIFSSGLMTINIVAKVNVGWILDVTLTCRAIGATGNFMGQGTWASESVIGSPLPTAGGVGQHMLPYNAAPAVGSNVDTSAAATLDLNAQWSTNNVGNSIQVHQYRIESLT